MNKYLSFSGVLLVSLTLLLSCHSESNQGSNELPNQEVRYIPVKLGDSNLWSILDIETGDILCSNEFKNEPTASRTSIITVQNNAGTYDYYDVHSTSRPINEGSYYSLTDFHSNGYALVSKPGQPISIIDSSCKEIATLSPEIQFCTISPQCYELFVFEDWDGNMGFMDFKGEVLKGSQYNYHEYAIIRSFKDGGDYAIVSPRGHLNYDSLFVINKSGEIDNLISLNTYNGFSAFQKSGRLSAFKGDSCFFLDKSGEILSVADLKSDKLYQVDLDNDRSIISDGEQFGLLDDKGKMLIRKKYDVLYHPIKGLYIAKKGSLWGYVDEKDNEVIPFLYSSLFPITGSRFMAEDKTKKKGERIILIDENNNQVGSNAFSAYACSQKDRVVSNYFNAQKVAAIICKGLSGSECFGYNRAFRIPDSPKIAEEIKLHCTKYNYQNYISSKDAGIDTSPFMGVVFHFRNNLSYGYRYSRSWDLIPTINKETSLRYLECEYRISQYLPSAFNQLTEALSDELKKIGFTPNENGFYVSSDDCAISIEKNEDRNAIIKYYFHVNDAK